MSIIKNNNTRQTLGFTLLEILIALFIFSLLSVILAGALRNVIHAYADTANKAQRLHALQMALLIISGDMEQAVNRPVWNASGKEEAAFVGDAHHFTLTHIGAGYTPKSTHVSLLQRVRYDVNEDNQILWRGTTAVLDQAAESRWQAQHLLEKVMSVEFQYVDKNKKLHRVWPVEGLEDQPLPCAVQLKLNLLNWGTISEVYVISSQFKKPTPPNASS
jgi:general secretion pathway protein J